MSMHARFAMIVVLAQTATASAQAPIVLRESFLPGTQYHVSARVELSGQLSVPGEKDKPAPVKIVGTSMAEYDERILAPLPGPPAEPRSLRLYRQIDMRRTIGDRQQEGNVRPSVRRLVILRRGHREVAFSPDGPLMWGEIDLIRTEVYLPALAGLLPDKAVKVGDKWKASPSAVEELTDLDTIRDGGLECRFEEVTTLAQRRAARVHFKGSVSGVNEDGPNKQQIEGYLLFDLESNTISYVTLNGAHELLDQNGKVSGRIEGRFTLARKAVTGAGDLSDSALRGVALEPNSDNALLMYDEPEHGLRFLYPRRWKVSGIRGRQVTLEDAGGVGLLITVLEKSPTPADYMTESADFLATQKAKVVKTDAPVKLAETIDLHRGGMDIELSGKPLRMDYYVLNQPDAGATIAATIPAKEVAASRTDIERIIRSMKLSKPAPVTK